MSEYSRPLGDTDRHKCVILRLSSPLSFSSTSKFGSTPYQTEMEEMKCLIIKPSMP